MKSSNSISETNLGSKHTVREADDKHASWFQARPHPLDHLGGFGEIINGQSTGGQVEALALF
jgi:hypothetical protein